MSELSQIDRMTFADVARQPQPDLVPAALLLVRSLAYPDLKPSTYLARLDNWIETLRRRMFDDEDLEARVMRASRFLFREVGLQGNEAEYYDPRNSFLNDVIERRLGIPITLSAIFIHVARGAGLEAEGIGLPGHFIAAVREGEKRHFLDPFDGETLALGELPAMLERRTGYRGPLTSVWLAPATTQAILVRMLHNLRGIYLHDRRWPQAVATMEHLALLQPDVSTHQRDLGFTLARMGRPIKAANCLEQYLAAEPEADDAGQVRQVMNTLYARGARLN